MKKIPIRMFCDHPDFKFEMKTLLFEDKMTNIGVIKDENCIKPYRLTDIPSGMGMGVGFHKLKEAKDFILNSPNYAPLIRRVIECRQTARYHKYVEELNFFTNKKGGTHGS